jgi:hypothetical protein
MGFWASSNQTFTGVIGHAIDVRTEQPCDSSSPRFVRFWRAGTTRFPVTCLPGLAGAGALIARTETGVTGCRYARCLSSFVPFGGGESITIAVSPAGNQHAAIPQERGCVALPPGYETASRRQGAKVRVQQFGRAYRTH